MTTAPPSPSWFAERLLRHASDLDIEVTPDVAGRVAAHLALMHAWNRRMNLTAIRDPETSLRRHGLESLEGLSLLPSDVEGGLLDLGSGNGFPALPLLASRPRLDGTLCEMRARKAAFLRAAAREVRVLDRVRVLDGRFDPAQPFAPGILLVTLRAFPDPAGTLASLFSRSTPPPLGAIAWMSDEPAQATERRLRDLGLSVDRHASRVTPGTSLLHARRPVTSSDPGRS